MTPEDEIELQKFRNEQQQRLELARKTALRFGILAITALIAFVYAFFQQAAVEKNQVEHGLNRQKVIERVKSAEEKATAFESLAKSEALRARVISEECQQLNKVSK